MRKVSWQGFSGGALRAPALSVVAALAAIVLIAPVATAAPVMPTIPNHLWLLDELGQGFGGKATPDEFGNLPLYAVKAGGGYVNPAGSGTRSPQLIGAGGNLPVLPKVGLADSSLIMGDADDPVAGLRSVPFKYFGNRSAVVDWGNPNFYPLRVNLTPDLNDLAALSGGGVHINGTSNGGGAISFWLNPINHSPNGYGHLFDFRNVNLANVDFSSNLAQQHIDANTNYRFKATGNSYPDGAAYEYMQVKSEDHGADDPYSLYRAPEFDWLGDPDPTDPYGLGSGVNWGGDDTPQSYPGGQWSNFVMTWAPDATYGGILTVYLNGAFLVDAVGMQVPDFYANMLTLGAKVGGDSAFSGMFDEVAIWDTPLTADNALWIYQNSLSNLGVPIPEPASATLLAMGLIGLASQRRRVEGRRRRL